MELSYKQTMSGMRGCHVRLLDVGHGPVVKNKDGREPFMQLPVPIEVVRSIGEGQTPSHQLPHINFTRPAFSPRAIFLSTLYETPY